MGMASRGEAGKRMKAMEAASGFGYIRLTQGLTALDTAVSLHDGPAMLGVMPVVWSKLLRAGAPVPAFLSAFAPSQAASQIADVEIEENEAEEEEEETEVCGVSLDQVLSVVKGTAGNAINADAPLMESGVDSLGAVELRNQLQGVAGQSVTLPSTLIFDHPTARQLAVLLAPVSVRPKTRGRRAMKLKPKGKSKAKKTQPCTVSLEQVLATVKRTAGGSINADAPLMESGVDSLGAVELRNQLQIIAGSSITLPSTLIFDHPTARQLAALVQPPGDVIADDEVELSALSNARGAPLSASIGGADALLAAGVSSMKEMWDMAATGLSVITEVPAERWDAKSHGLPEPTSVSVGRFEPAPRYLILCCDALLTCLMAVFCRAVRVMAAS